jgi:hypothetical protein
MTQERDQSAFKLGRFAVPCCAIADTPSQIDQL